MERYQPDVKIRVIIPAFNEEEALPLVIDEIPKHLVNEIIVVDNGSTDGTYQVAIAKGVTVLSENRPGYGSACLRGIKYLKSKRQTTDIVVFLDGDHSDYPMEMPTLVNPILHDDFDFVIGTRALGSKEKGAMTLPQIFGNWLATRLIQLFYGKKFSDLGPFRAITFDKLILMDMQDTTFGWTVEMQLKAAKMNIKTLDVIVSYRKRIGKSKISGTIKGTLLAGYKIITTIFRYL